jgi:hypothetical protein
MGVTNLASAMSKQGAGDMATRRDGLDRYDTPAWATRALMDRAVFYGKIHEPAAGAGLMVDELAKSYMVTAADIEPRRAEFEQIGFLNETRLVQNIVTNPPYGIATEFLQKAIEITERSVAMLVGINFLSSAKRGRLYRSGGAPSDILIFERRILFIQADGSPIKSQAHISCWMIWNAEKCRARAAWPEDTRIDWIPA